MIDLDSLTEAQRAVVQAEIERQRVQAISERLEIRDIMSMPAGRRFITRLLAECGMHRISHSGELTHDTAFKEGQRNIGNWVYAQVEDACLDYYVLSLKEKAEAQKALQEVQKVNSAD